MNNKINSRECDMKKVETYIVSTYYGFKTYFSEIEENIVMQNVMMQFYEFILKDKEVPYIKHREGKDVDFNELLNVIRNYPISEIGFKVVGYKIPLKSDHYIDVQLELLTGYISLSTTSQFKNDFDLLDKVNLELVLCRGIRQDDIDTKNMFYYHYQFAQKELLRKEPKVC